MMVSDFAFVGPIGSDSPMSDISKVGALRSTGSGKLTSFLRAWVVLSNHSRSPSNH